MTDVTLCPGCKRADPIKKCEYPSANPSTGIAVSVTVPKNLCGRCGQRVADACLSAATLALSKVLKQ